jgi:hypothetical protein
MAQFGAARIQREHDGASLRTASSRVDPLPLSSVTPSLDASSGSGPWTGPAAPGRPERVGDHHQPTDRDPSRLGQQRAARGHDPLRGQLCRRHQQVDLRPGRSVCTTILVSLSGMPSRRHAGCATATGGRGRLGRTPGRHPDSGPSAAGCRPCRTAGMVGIDAISGRCQQSRGTARFQDARPAGQAGEPTKQDLGIIGRMAVPVSPVGAQERRKIELIHHIREGPAKMVGRRPVAQVRGARSTDRGRRAGSCRP